MKWVWNKANDFQDFVNVISQREDQAGLLASKPLSSSGTSIFLATKHESSLIVF